MTTARFHVRGRFDRIQSSTATVTIDRQTSLITVRPYRRRRTYTMRLDDVAELIAWRVIKAEVAEQQRDKIRRRRARRGLLRVA